MSAYNQIDPAEDESHQTISSYFLGPKAENYEFFLKRVTDILEAQRDARLDYFPRDGLFITPEVQASTAYRASTRKMTNAVRKASYLMGQHSIPFWSPRYQGHMCMDLSMPACLGYFMTMLYNPNNVAFEASPLTTVVEKQVGEDLCTLFGFNLSDRQPLSTADDLESEWPVAWGHLTADGSIANLEAIWVARNLKFYPLSIRSAMKEDGPLAFIAESFEIKTCIGTVKLLQDLSTWELLNLKPETILDIPKRLHDQYYISPVFLNGVMQKYGIQSTGMRSLQKEFDVPDPQLFVSNTRHYSWPKGTAITGIGSDNCAGIKVDHGARIDIDDLRSKLQDSLDKKKAVYAVVAVIGTTEEGAVDPLADIVALREEFQKEGLSFLIHADAAWGGYFCTMLPQGYKPGDELRLHFGEGSGAGFVPDASLREATQKDLFMIRKADSVTVDPHKAAYVPYPAGALCYRDGRLRYLITWTAPYLAGGAVGETAIGVFGVEGSKPGASPMAAWFSNKCIGLGPDGYGKLLSEVTFTCSRMSAGWAAMSTEEDPFVVVPLNELPSELAKDSTPEKVEAEKQKIRDRILLKSNEEIVKEDESRPDDEKTMSLLRALGSDLNINAFGVNWRYADGKLNDEVEESNYLNRRIMQRFSVDTPEDDPTKIPLYLSSTTFAIKEYGDCAQHFKKRLGLFQDSVDLDVLRNVVMSPWPTDGNFLVRLGEEFKKVLKEEVEVCRKRNDTSPTKQQFLLQGTDKVYIVNFPRFHLEAQRQQLIVQVGFPKDVMDKYLKAKKDDPSALLVLETAERHDISIGSIRNKEKFTTIIKKLEGEKQKGSAGSVIATDFVTETISILKDKSLRGRYRDESYPTDVVPFYLYGTPNSLNLDHILVRSPNVQLSAENVQISLSKGGSDSAKPKRHPLLGDAGVSDEKGEGFSGRGKPPGSFGRGGPSGRYGRHDHDDRDASFGRHDHDDRFVFDGRHGYERDPDGRAAYDDRHDCHDHRKQKDDDSKNTSSGHYTNGRHDRNGGWHVESNDGGYAFQVADDESKDTSSDHGSIPADILDKGAILLIEGISEASMQPFPPTKSNNQGFVDTLGSNSAYFFRSDQEFDFAYYQDDKDINTPGPGLADVSKLKKLGEGKLRLGQSIYVDSVQINKDPYEQIDGEERYLAWKKTLDSIGQELE